MARFLDSSTPPLAVVQCLIAESPSAVVLIATLQTGSEAVCPLYTSGIGGALVVTRRDVFILTLACMRLRAQAGELPVYLFSLQLAEARSILSEENFSRRTSPRELEIPSDVAKWLKWETARDQEIRSRLKRGEADSIVNLVLFGTSFTARSPPEY